MNIRHSRRISRNAAEELLGGHSVPDQDSLTRLLAAAAASARDEELAGEAMAVAAFESDHLVVLATPQKERKSMLAKLITTKFLVSSLAAFATGGVALAASTGTLPGSGSAPAATSTSITGQVQASGLASAEPSRSSSPQPTAPASPVTSASPLPPTSASPSASGPASAATLPQTATALCHALIAAVTSQTGSGAAQASQSADLQALASSRAVQVAAKSEFGALVSVARSAAAVPDYCALLLTLPQLPDPGALASLPGPLLGQLLSGLPTSALAPILTSLPSATLGQVLTSLPASVLSAILTELPASTAAGLLNELPASVLSQLPSSVLSQLPSSVVGGLSTTLQAVLGL